MINSKLIIGNIFYFFNSDIFEDVLSLKEFIIVMIVVVILKCFYMIKEDF